MYARKHSTVYIFAIFEFILINAFMRNTFFSIIYFKSQLKVLEIKKFSNHSWSHSNLLPQPFTIHSIIKFWVSKAVFYLYSFGSTVCFFGFIEKRHIHKSFQLFFFWRKRAIHQKTTFGLWEKTIAQLRKMFRKIPMNTLATISVTLVF